MEEDDNSYYSIESEKEKLHEPVAQNTFIHNSRYDDDIVVSDK